MVACEEAPVFDFMQVMEQDGYVVDLSDPEDEVAWLAALDTWVEEGDLAENRVHEVECDLAIEGDRWRSRLRVRRRWRVPGGGRQWWWWCCCWTDMGEALGRCGPVWSG